MPSPPGGARTRIRDLRVMMLQGPRTYTLVKVESDAGLYGIGEAYGSPGVGVIEPGSGQGPSRPRRVVLGLRSSVRHSLIPTRHPPPAARILDWPMVPSMMSPWPGRRPDSRSLITRESRIPQRPERRRRLRSGTENHESVCPGSTSRRRFRGRSEVNVVSASILSSRTWPRRHPRQCGLSFLMLLGLAAWLGLAGGKPRRRRRPRPGAGRGGGPAAAGGRAGRGRR